MRTGKRRLHGIHLDVSRLPYGDVARVIPGLRPRECERPVGGTRARAQVEPRIEKTTVLEPAVRGAAPHGCVGSMRRAPVTRVEGSARAGADRHASAEHARTHDDLRDGGVGREEAEASREGRMRRDTSQSDDLDVSLYRRLVDAFEDHGRGSCG